MLEIPFLQIAVPLMALALFLGWLLFAEYFWPLRDCTLPFWARMKTHLLLAVPHLLVSLLVSLPLLIATALLAEELEIGLVRWLPVSSLPASVIAFIALDYSLYIWHRLTHRVSWLWRFHRVHHSDGDLSLVSALRFHFGETLCSAPFRTLAVALLGADVVIVLLYEVLLQAAVAFHHSNWDLSRGFDRFLQRFLVTPRLHGIHHSNREIDTDSNFASLLNLWDYLHGTFRNGVRQHGITIGAPHDSVGSGRVVNSGNADQWESRSPWEPRASELLAAPFSMHRRPSNEAAQTPKGS